MNSRPIHCHCHLDDSIDNKYRRLTLYKNRYRNETTRLLNWDYSTAAPYFITVCTEGRQPWFGEITQGEMRLSEIGMQVQSEWLRSPQLRPDMNLMLDEFVVMPDHFHGIIIIGNNCYNQTSHQAGNQFGSQSKNLASIMRGFKSAVTMQARRIVPKFCWQPRYYDHVIRDDASMIRIRQYIVDNPSKWKR